MKLFGELSNLL